MDIPQGYKQTELGIIPEDWDVKQIRDGLTLLTDFDANGSFADMAENVQTYIGGGYAWHVRATDLEQKTPLSEVKYVDESSYKFLKKSSLFGGEVLLAKRGDIGKVYLFEAKTMYATLAPNLYLLKLNQKIRSTYLYYYLKSSNGQKTLKDINASTSLGALYKEDVKNLYVLCPSIVEQKLIAEALTDIDGLIAALDKKIAKKRLIKQGMMQQLLTGKKRLPGYSEPWVKKELGEIGYTYSGLTGKSKADFGQGNAKYITFLNVLTNPILKEDLFESVMIKENEQQNKAQLGDLFFNTSSETPEEVGTCAVLLSHHEGLYLNSFCFGYRLTDNNVVGLYLAYYFRSRLGRQLMTSLAQGATRYNLSKELFNSSKIILPKTKNEQIAIATVLSDMDKEIADLEAKRDKYCLLKSGMMQKLLTGQIRLKIK